MKLSSETSRHPPNVAQHFNKLHSHSPTNHDSVLQPRQQNTPQSPQSQSLTPILTVCPSISVSALSMCQLWSAGNISNRADTVLTWVSTSPWAQLPTDIATTAHFNTFLLYQWLFLIMFHLQLFIINSSIRENKFALLWGEAQLCLPYVCF